MTNPSFFPDSALLERYLAGECSPDEAARVKQWIEADVTRRQTVVGIKSLDATHVDRERHTNVDALWERVVARGIAAERQSAQSVPQGHTVAGNAGHGFRGVAGTQQNRGYWAVAAGVLVAAVLLVIGFSASGTKFMGMFFASRTAHMTYATANGQRATITLSDGNTVVLDVASRLDVPADYATGNHTVHLTGEALFTVKHHGNLPFAVVSGGTTTRVLGTTFLVRRYPLDHQTVVSVDAGKVAVGQAVLTAGRRIEMQDDGALRIGAADTGDFSFAAGTLTLAEMPLAQAIPELDRWYDVDIKLGSPELAERHIVGEFRAGSVADARAILAMTFNARVVTDGRTLTLFPR